MLPTLATVGVLSLTFNAQRTSIGAFLSSSLFSTSCGFQLCFSSIQRRKDLSSKTSIWSSPKAVSLGASFLQGADQLSLTNTPKRLSWKANSTQKQSKMLWPVEYCYRWRQSLGLSIHYGFPMLSGGGIKWVRSNYICSFKQAKLKMLLSSVMWVDEIFICCLRMLPSQDWMPSCFHWKVHWRFQNQWYPRHLGRRLQIVVSSLVQRVVGSLRAQHTGQWFPGN